MVVRVEQTPFGRRIATATVVALALMSLLIVRLWYLQVLKGNYFRDLSENNRIRTLRTVAARGMVYDRNGKILVGNRPSFQIALILEDTPNVEETLKQLSEITGRSLEELKKQLLSQRSRFHFEPKVVISDASREDLARVKVNSHRLPGVIVEVVPTRNYPESSLAAQVMGYSREISKEQLDSLSPFGYRSGDIVGTAGIEKQFESELRGKSGFRQIEVDAMGRRKGELGTPDDLPGFPGRDLVLTIDSDLQRIAESALGERRGAVVAIDPANGDILVLASTPTYDANIFSGQVSSEAWQSLNKDPNHPLINRAISQVYPPGSTFKLVTTLAALAEHQATEHTEFNCPGYFMFAGRPYHCHKRTGHGTVSLRKALMVSCNAYYFHLGQVLGISAIQRYGALLGLGSKSGVPLPNEVPGIIPSEAWKKKTLGERWYPGDTLPVSIGQGYVVVTPMQMANLAAAISNGGTLYEPRLATKLIDRLTNTETELPPKIIHRIDVPEAIFDNVRSIATGVVNDPQGTGKAAKIDGIVVAGKTGTAQVGRLGKEALGEKFKDHAWFVSFAPADHPLLAMAVLVENSGHGGQYSAPIAKELYEAYFRKRGMLPEPTPTPSPTPAANGKPAKTKPTPAATPDPDLADEPDETDWDTSDSPVTSAVEEGD